MVWVSPAWLRASLHQMALGQVGFRVAVGSGGGVGVDLLAMIAWTCATAVRRTFVAWASGELSGCGWGAVQARRVSTTQKSKLSPASSGRAMYAVSMLPNHSTDCARAASGLRDQ